MGETEAEERLEGGHRSAASVVAEDELVEVGLQVLVADAAVGAVHPGLQVADRAVRLGEQVLAALVASRGAAVVELLSRTRWTSRSTGTSASICCRNLVTVQDSIVEHARVANPAIHAQRFENIFDSDWQEPRVMLVDYYVSLDSVKTGDVQHVRVSTIYVHFNPIRVGKACAVKRRRRRECEYVTVSFDDHLGRPALALPSLECDGDPARRLRSV